MSVNRMPNFNQNVCLSPNEYIGQIPCPTCGSSVRRTKSHDCASCIKTEAANKKAAGDFHRKRNELDLQKEIRQIENEFEYDLVEY